MYNLKSSKKASRSAKPRGTQVANEDSKVSEVTACPEVLTHASLHLVEDADYWHRHPASRTAAAWNQLHQEAS